MDEIIKQLKEIKNEIQNLHSRINILGNDTVNNIAELEKKIDRAIKNSTKQIEKKIESHNK